MSRKLLLVTFCASFAAGISAPLLAQTNLATTLPVDPQVTIGKLANGLTY